MPENNNYLIFTIEEKKYALHINSVKRVFMPVEITVLPDGPAIFSGVINIRGTIVPVINMRKRLLLPEREIRLFERFIYAYFRKRGVILPVDEVTGLTEAGENDISSADDIFPGLKYIKGIMKLKNDIILIKDLEQFLSPDEVDYMESISKGVWK